jgi:O-antigen chain-terminating methyltransferase
MDCTWPNDVFLSFLIFMREVLVGVQEFPAPARAGWFNPDRLPEPYRSAVWRMLHVSFDQWRFADFVDNFASGKDGGVDAPAQIDRGNAAVLLAALESGIAELRAQIANLESHTARYDHLIKNLQVPNAPRALKLVLPLARLVRVLRGALSGS